MVGEAPADATGRAPDDGDESSLAEDDAERWEPEARACATAETTRAGREGIAEDVSSWPTGVAAAEMRGGSDDCSHRFRCTEPTTSPYAVYSSYHCAIGDAVTSRSGMETNPMQLRR